MITITLPDDWHLTHDLTSVEGGGVLLVPKDLKNTPTDPDNTFMEELIAAMCAPIEDEDADPTTED